MFGQIARSRVQRHTVLCRLRFPLLNYKSIKWEKVFENERFSEKKMYFGSPPPQNNKRFYMQMNSTNNVSQKMYTSKIKKKMKKEKQNSTT